MTKNTVSAPFPETQTFMIGGQDGKFVFESIETGTDPKAVKARELEQQIATEVVESLKAADSPLNQTQIVGLVRAKVRKVTVLEVLKGLARGTLSAVRAEPRGRTLEYSLAEQAAGDPTDPRAPESK